MKNSFVITRIVCCLVAASAGTSIAVGQPHLTNTAGHGNTIYVGGVGPGNYSNIQSGINASNDGDTVFVYDDSSPYHENVVIDKSIQLLGECKETTVIDGAGSRSVVQMTADGATLSRFTIQYTNSSEKPPSYGVEIKANDDTFSIGEIKNVDYGVFVHPGSENNDINSGYIHDFTLCGIFLDADTSAGCCDNRIFNFTISTSKAPVLSTCGITIRGGSTVGCESAGNVIHNNTVSNNGYGILLDNRCLSNEIKDNHVIDNVFNGICLTSSDSNKIHGNTIQDNGNVGINLIASCSNEIYNNTIQGHGALGVWLTSSSNANAISTNSIVLNTKGGIACASSNSNILLGNTIDSNGATGIGIESSNGCYILYNIITHNDGDGICLSEFSWTDIQNNNISANTVYGIESLFGYADNDLFVYSNNFMKNGLRNAADHNSNLWDGDWTYAGNYWDDHPGGILVFHKRTNGNDWTWYNAPYYVCAVPNEDSRDRYPLAFPTKNAPGICIDIQDMPQLTVESMNQPCQNPEVPKTRQDQSPLKVNGYITLKSIVMYDGGEIHEI